MGVVKRRSKKSKEVTVKNETNGKAKRDEKKKKKKVSCLQCFKSPDDGGLEGKYRVAAPELMQDTFMSDSEDEGEVECPIQQQQQYRYMNSEAGTLNRAKPLEDSVTDGHLWPSNNDSRVATIERQPLDIGFLVSFVVDARGGAMKAKRRGGVRIIVPPAACAAPTRVTCRAATRRAPAAAPPPLMEGEALASRLLELQPQGAKFLAPVIIEVPIFTASCPEREIVILRSDTGETWQDHYLHNNDNAMIQEALTRERQDHGNSGETLGENGERVTRIITCDFPHYLAVVSRVRQEVHIIGPEGGTVSSAHIPQVQALFPPQALTKRIRVGLQAHGAGGSLCRRVLPRHAAVSPVLTVEPRRRKFHRSITLTVPLPHSADQKPGEKPSTANLRLLCSIMGGQARAVWEDVTGSTPLTITDDCASFTTTVSARFWLMNCQNVSDATKLATELYRQMLVVPFEVRIVVLGKRLDALEGRLLVLYITDRYAYETLLQQEHYTEIAHSTSVRFLDGKEVFLEFSGNLVPVTKSGSQPLFTFEAFKDNRVEFTVRVKHHEESPSGRIYFMNEPKVAKGEQSQTPACVLDVELPERIAPRAAKSQIDYLNLDQSGFDALKDELSFHWGDHNHSIGPPPLPTHHETSPQLNGHDKNIANGNVKFTPTDADDVKPKPQVNGDSVHVDSNKVKATFDSDEDKTPMNTLEKGKKKPEGFFGGLAGKVKNVFGHSEEKDDSKESSPKPQPKPRESKEKSPPKPAPRIINEDLLEKVDDMFKDLKVKPHVKIDEDANNQVYLTKLIVDEDQPSLKEKTDETYHQYEHMQPVDTPLHCHKTDPFQFYTGCCEGKYKKGEKHRHDETSNLADRIEQVNFTIHETTQEVADRSNGESKDVLDRLDNEKDNLKSEVSKVNKNLQNYKNDLVIVEETLKDNVKDSANDIKSFAGENNCKCRRQENAKNNIDTLKSDVRSQATAEVENIKSAAQDIVNNLLSQSNPKSSDHKALVMDFLAAEQMEASKHISEKNDTIKVCLEENENTLKNKAQEGLTKIKNTAQEVKDDINQKTNDFKAGVKDKAESVKEATKEKVIEVKENLSNKANNIKEETKNKIEDIKDVTSEKLNDLEDTLDSAKEKTEKVAENIKTKAKDTKENIKAEGKKKSKEGKNFFTGLVHNIFGEKDKAEEEIKSKSKKSASKLAKQASQIKEDADETVAKKQEQCVDFLQNESQQLNNHKENIINEGEDLIKKVQNKTDELKGIVQTTKDAVDISVQDVVNNVESSKDAAIENVQDHSTQLIQNVENKKNDITQELLEAKDNALHTVQETTDNVIKQIDDKKDEVKQNAYNQAELLIDDVETSFKEKEQKLQKTEGKVVQFLETKTNEMLDEIQGNQDLLKQNKNNLVERLNSEKDNLVHSTQGAKEHALHDLHDKTSQVVESINQEKDKVIQAAQSKRDEIVDNVQAKKDEFSSAIQDKSDAAEKALSDTKTIVEDVVQKKKGDIIDTHTFIQNAANDHMDRIRQEAEIATEDIKRTAEETLNAAVNKKSNIQANIASKVDEINDAGKDSFDNIQHAVSHQVGNTKESAQQAVDYVKDSSLGAFDKLETATKDKVNDAKDTWDDLQSSTRDTYADIKDDVQGLESSAQDTLHSLQSSAGNTFDSLEDSAKEVIADAQSTAQKTEEGSKELFGIAKDTFEGFTVTAGNKLEDVKGAANERKDEAVQRLEKAESDLAEGVSNAEATIAESVTSEADKFANNLNDLGNSVFGMSGKGFMKDSSKKLLDSEKSQSSPHRKGSGIPKLKKKKK
ncbi:unnamed protein product [Leptosia nina]|uniref:ZU5 domain-containing protein n=1 Tax=Leptosia nina TaxID=320188 RepID=A0AAV1JB78_9NEOP